MCLIFTTSSFIFLFPFFAVSFFMCPLPSCLLLCFNSHPFKCPFSPMHVFILSTSNVHPHPSYVHPHHFISTFSPLHVLLFTTSLIHSHPFICVHSQPFIGPFSAFSCVHPHHFMFLQPYPEKVFACLFMGSWTEGGERGREGGSYHALNVAF